MAKVKLNKLFKEIYGKVNKGYPTFRRFRKTIVMENYPKPSYVRTTEQDKVRTAYKQALLEWQQMDEETKAQYREEGRKVGLPGYQYYMKIRIPQILAIVFSYSITIDNTQNDNNLTDYQVLLNIQNDSQFFTDIQDRKYMEFYDSDQTTLLNHYVEEWDTTNNNAKIWIKIPSIPANATKTIYLKVNTQRTNDLSNPNTVFDFFDDFDGNTIDIDKWSGNVSSFSISNSIIQVSLSTKWIYTKVFTITDGIVEAKVKIDTGARGSTHARSSQSDTFGSPYINSYNINYRYPNGDVRARKWYGGSESVLNLSAYTHDVDWHIARIKLSGATIIFEYEKLDGTNKYSYETTDTAISSGYIGLASDAIDSGSIYYDWVRVRKFTSPEPSITYTKIA